MAAIAVAVERHSTLVVSAATMSSSIALVAISETAAVGALRLRA
ncbi:MAG: hypothetical protein ABSG93_06085 [Solirubrobacteraceae bacterium]